MKKYLLFVLPMLVMISCAPEAEKPLPPPSTETFTVNLNTSNSTLTGDDSTENLTVNLSAIEDETVSYQLEIGAPCYLHHRFDEIVIKQGGYFKSLSTYHVDRLIVDFYGGSLNLFGVYANAEGTGSAVMYHESSVAPVDAQGGGVVYEYPIDSTGWMIKNTAGNDQSKPGIYSVTVVFAVEK